MAKKKVIFAMFFFMKIEYTCHLYLRHCSEYSKKKTKIKSKNKFTGEMAHITYHFVIFRPCIHH